MSKSRNEIIRGAQSREVRTELMRHFSSTDYSGSHLRNAAKVSKSAGQSEDEFQKDYEEEKREDITRSTCGYSSGLPGADN